MRDARKVVEPVRVKVTMADALIACATPRAASVIASAA